MSTGAPGANRGQGRLRVVPRGLGGCGRDRHSRPGAENAPGAMPQRSLAEDAAPACAAREKVLSQQRGQARRTVCRERIAKRRNPRSNRRRRGNPDYSVGDIGRSRLLEHS